ncbi:hypothetical protein [Thauera sp.]|uniref:hypothetical protein n=1 Tax=Thauera sp. TaxID=1905334 RepID=UPI0039E2D688
MSIPTMPDQVRALTAHAAANLQELCAPVCNSPGQVRGAINRRRILALLDAGGPQTNSQACDVLADLTFKSTQYLFGAMCEQGWVSRHKPGRNRLPAVLQHHVGRPGCTGDDAQPEHATIDGGKDMNTPLYPPEDYVVHECLCDGSAELCEVLFVLDDDGGLSIIDDDQVVLLAPADVHRLARLLATLEVSR